MRCTARFALILVLALGACKKKAEPPPNAGSGSGSGSAISDAEKVAKGMAETEAEAAKEKARWTPEITAAAVALRDQTAADTTAALTAIVAGPHREPGNKDRDAWRHPVETLTFFGLQPTHTVVEVGSAGWYTELLAPLLANRGKLVVVAPDATAPAGKMSTVYGRSTDLFLAKSPELFGKVQRLGIVSADSLAFGPAGSADLVIAMREMHNWQRRKELAKYLAAVHAVLKPGGTFGIEQHRAAPGTKGEDTADKGYLAEQWVIDQVTAAGFELVEKSEINANPKDTKDYPKGVWTLPPNYREGETDKAKYTAIGESDRMTLKFKRP
jgi:predicted methyltransferase